MQMKNNCDAKRFVKLRIVAGSASMFVKFYEAERRGEFSWQDFLVGISGCVVSKLCDFV